jgi:UDP-N-acetylmuramoylalanine--D-glutamate ligase
MSVPATRPALLPSRVAVLGFARSGRALTEALLERGVEVAVADDRSASAFPGLADFEARGARFYLGSDPRRGSDQSPFLDGAGWLVLSPGVPPTHAAVSAAKARGVPVLSELEVAWRIAEEESEGANRWVAVTGTNGKSTTTAWIAEILGHAERPVALAGNIGPPLSGFLGTSAPRDFVCEVSSFQLEAVERFRPDVAVLTNVTPDHLDRYASFDEYAAAKARVFENQRETDFAVVNADDPVASRTRSRARRVPFSRRGPAPGGTWYESGRLFSEARGGRREVLAAERVALPGAHNLENALAALAAADVLGAPPAAIEAGLTRVAGLPHPTEHVREESGVRWVNDSKGTNVDATVKSLEGLPGQSVLLILGGRDKHGDFEKLVLPVARAARAVLTIGEAADKIAAVLDGHVEVERCVTLDRAVARAAELAHPGDTVLLSPACASFDQYGNFEERGEHFKALVSQGTTGEGSDPLRGSDPERGQTPHG